jgi:hypothetical protein
MYHAYFPPEALELQEELQNHQELCSRLSSAGPLEQDFPAKLAIIGTYCDVLIHGYYDVDEIIKLCGLLTIALKKKRTEIILPFPAMKQ